MLGPIVFTAQHLRYNWNFALLCCYTSTSEDKYCSGAVLRKWIDSVRVISSPFLMLVVPASFKDWMKRSASPFVAG